MKSKAEVRRNINMGGAYVNGEKITIEEAQNLSQLIKDKAFLNKYLVIRFEFNQFLYEVTNATPIEQLIEQLVEINNLRIIIDRLAVSIEDLATHGVMKPEELRGLSEPEVIKQTMETLSNDKKKYCEPPVPKNGERYNQDPSAYRYGLILNEQVTNMMIEQVVQAKQAISKENVALKKNLVASQLKQQIDLLRGAVMIAYPGYYGLPEWEPAKLILENQFQFEGREFDVGDYLEAKNTSLWWAGKELLRSKLLRDYTGKNEKTKIIAKLTKTGSSAPAREPMIDQETHKKMLSYYYKKQEENKKKMMRINT
ncbi:hypothetical protein IMG5_166570 [Ichthyophthirius multifiliis]|uniref:Uncharacterized protein n=1 Tax=Ichthyophthirius multifiliis TaxID=5932 RepID=G0R0S5_ICHMU|nr:hypothetical protein IMG5_166570 [Ichthyophthirius multifiliis]EGR28937.1 hypothetical protein IMG5_166570 [Ichthyophthirius multifiliis]|eukprot:XP_004030173.1 hypothetical protein IMG5_166570 [Ichthyophthirius multifiliis]